MGRLSYIASLGCAAPVVHQSWASEHLFRQAVGVFDLCCRGKLWRFFFLCFLQIHCLLGGAALVVHQSCWVESVFHAVLMDLVRISFSGHAFWCVSDAHFVFSGWWTYHVQCCVSHALCSMSCWAANAFLHNFICFALKFLLRACVLWSFRRCSSNE